jgi:hypothetical protein
MLIGLICILIAACTLAAAACIIVLYKPPMLFIVLIFALGFSTAVMVNASTRDVQVVR